MSRANTDWFKEAGWGVFTHFLVDVERSADAWNARIDAFDVAGLADQLEDVGAKYLMLTIGQNSGHYCAPNATYDAIVGIEPSKCARRDLVNDLCDALRAKNIRLMVYLPSGAPNQDVVAAKKLQWENGPQMECYKPCHGLDEQGKLWGSVNPLLVEFQRKWESIIKEWSDRWGEKISGWWFDGCYFSNAMYRRSNSPNFESFALAAKSGNRNSIVAFSGGVHLPVVSLTEYEDYTGGEVSEAFPTCPGRWVKGAQYHVLSYLGKTWCEGDRPRFTDDFAAGYTREVIARGGVVTWDVPVDEGGTIVQSFIEQLKCLNNSSI